MIDRIARLVVQQALSYARHSFQRDLAVREYLARVEADGRAWVDRANEIGLDTAPSDEDIARFTAWLNELASDTPAPAHTAEASRFSESFRSSAAFAKGSSRAPASASRRPVLKGSLPEVFTKALQSCIAFAASSPRTAALIPPYFYNVLENNYLPFDQSKHGHHVMCDDWRLSARFHQMLGYEMSCQDAATVGEKNVLLLQLHSDQGLYMGFGDVGAASFWIKADDLKALKFDNAWGEIVGH